MTSINSLRIVGVPFALFLQILHRGPTTIQSREIQSTIQRLSILEPLGEVWMRDPRNTEGGCSYLLARDEACCFRPCETSVQN